MDTNTEEQNLMMQVYIDNNKKTNDNKYKEKNDKLDTRKKCMENIMANFVNP